MIRTYTYKIRHQYRYQEQIEQFLGVCRYVYNLAKETKEESYKAGLSLSNYDLQKQFTPCRQSEDYKWLRELPVHSAQAVIERLDKAFKTFFKGGGYPKWAAKHKWKSIPFKACKQVNNNTFKLPKIGEIKVFNKYGTIKGEIRTASIVKKADGYYLHVQVKTEVIKREIIESQDVSIDMGLKYFCVTSEGEFVDNPNINQRTEKKLKRLNRKLSRAKKGSNNRIKIVNQLQRLHLKRERQRKDFLHKTSSRLAKGNSIIYLEDLKVSKMVRSKRFSKGISDVGWGYFRTMLEYKTNVHAVNPAYTSQTCSNCGHVGKENRKTQAEFKCTSCGHTDNADSNACKEILKRGRADLKNGKVKH